jgi:hypothetical protein
MLQLPCSCHIYGEHYNPWVLQVMLPFHCLTFSCRCFTLYVSAYMAIFRSVGCFYCHIPEGICFAGFTCTWLPFVRFHLCFFVVLFSSLILLYLLRVFLCLPFSVMNSITMFTQLQALCKIESIICRSLALSSYQVVMYSAGITFHFQLFTVRHAKILVSKFNPF